MSFDPLSPGTELLQYRLAQRISSSVWRAEDTRSGKAAALKILTRQMPKDPARREEALRQVRLGAALYHPFLVPIHDVIVAGDVLAMVMDFIPDAQPLTAWLRGEPRDRQEFFRIAYQLGDVVKLLQARNMVHGNITGDAVMIQPNGQVRLGGLNLLNLLPRKEGSSSPAFQQKGSDPRSVAYMAPEQIAGQVVDFRTDVFSIGVVLYELATGVLPWTATSAGDIARAIVEGQPRSPMAVNPAIGPQLVETIGKCIYKDPFRRYKDVRALVDEIAARQADAVRFASDLVAKTNAPAATTASKADAKNSILFVADIDAAASSDPTRDAARMQQVIGEAVYLFDGNVIDPFGAKFIAELPSVDAALEAARKAEFDIEPEQQDGIDLPIRLLLHAGSITLQDGTATGDAIDKGFRALAAMPKRKLFISEDFVKVGRGSVRMRDAGARGGLKLYEIVPPEPRETLSVAPTHLDTAATELDASAPPLPPIAPRKHRAILFGTAGALLLAVGIGGVMMSRDAKEAAPAVAAAAPSTPAVRDFVIAPFQVEGAEPALLERAAAIRLAVIELLRDTPNVRVIDAASPTAMTYSAAIHPNSPTQIIPTSGVMSGPPAPLADNASGILALAQWITSQAHVQIRAATPDALNAFADALAARANNDTTKAETSLRAAVTADPSFLAAQLVAMDFFASRGNDNDAFAAAKQVLSLAPSNTDAARRVARGSIASGDIPSALNGYGAVLKTTPNDAEALNAVGRYALSVGDAQRFNAALGRLRKLTPDDVAIHAPDLLLAGGKFDDAVQKYYDVEVNSPNNPSLALKIGRIAVLRHTPDIAKLELEKLEKHDPAYGGHLLKAYMAAEEKSNAAVDAELKEALKGSKPGDDYWTSVAEIRAMLGDAHATIEALKRAADRREPTISYVLADPVFSFVASDSSYQQVRASLEAEQQEIRGALAQIAM